MRVCLLQCPDHTLASMHKPNDLFHDTAPRRRSAELGLTSPEFGTERDATTSKKALAGGHLRWPGSSPRDCITHVGHDRQGRRKAGQLALPAQIAPRSLFSRAKGASNAPSPESFAASWQLAAAKTTLQPGMLGAEPPASHY